MTVLDASVLVDALVVRGASGDAARAAIRERNTLQVPAIFGAEVTSALRSMVARGDVSPRVARGALVRLRMVRAIRYPFEPFVDRVWDLRENLTVYDAWYVALAEWADAALVTADDRLRRAPGVRCAIEFVAVGGAPDDSGAC